MANDLTMSDEVSPKTAEVEIPIRTIRGQRVILDTDLAQLYGVTPKRLNEQVRRNSGRFPKDFAFPLTRQEVAILRSQIATSRLQTHGGRRVTPTAFTEHGALMVATVLQSDEAVAMSIFVIRAFVRMRDALAAHVALEKRLKEIESTLLSHDDALRQLFTQIRPLLLPPPAPSPKKIGFGVREPRVRYQTRKDSFAHA